MSQSEEMTRLEECQSEHGRETVMLQGKGIGNAAFEVLPWGLYWFTSTDDLRPAPDFREGHIEGHCIFEWKQKEVEQI